jgi:pimeloyl-ACP methyl ester carboxylesterase
MGGAIAQKYLETHPAPAAVLLASAPPKGVIPATLRFARRHPLVFLKVNLTMSMFPVVGTPELCREYLFSADLPADALAAYFSRLQDESYRAYLDIMLLNLPRPKRVQAPMIVLGARRDALFVRSECEATALAYGTQAETLDVAHDMMLEPGWQEVADRILARLYELGL